MTSPRCTGLRKVIAYGYSGTYWASLVAQMVKNLPAMWETQVRSLGLEDSQEKEMATHSCLENSMDRGYSPWGCKGSDMTDQLTHLG